MSTGTQGFDSNDLPIVPGIVSGAGAFVIGYLVTFLLKSGAVSNLMSSGGGPAPGNWQVVGWIFFKMHNVGLSVSVPTGGGMNIGSQLPMDSWMLAIPIVLLLVGGFLVAYTADVDDPVDGALSGAIVAAPYFVLSVLFAFVTTWSFSAMGASVSVGPSIVMAAILAGIVYPAVLGAIGGAASGALEA